MSNIFSGSHFSIANIDFLRGVHQLNTPTWSRQNSMTPLPLDTVHFLKVADNGQFDLHRIDHGVNPSVPNVLRPRDGFKRGFRF